MMTAAEMAALAEQFAGGLEERQRALLPGLCRVAETELRCRLRADAEGYEEALGYASALVALELVQADTPLRFTAGDFSVSRGNGGDLRTQALRMLRPWLASDIVFEKV